MNLEQEIKYVWKKVSYTSNWTRGKNSQKIYIEEASDIFKEYYLSCLVDRASSKIAFISSTEGGVGYRKSC